MYLCSLLEFKFYHSRFHASPQNNIDILSLIAQIGVCFNFIIYFYVEPCL